MSLTWASLRTRDCRLGAHESTQSRLLYRSLSSGEALPGGALMDIVYACCAGLDVHKETMVATVRCRLDNGKVPQ